MSLSNRVILRFWGWTKPTGFTKRLLNPSVNSHSHMITGVVRRTIQYIIITSCELHLITII